MKTSIEVLFEKINGYHDKGKHSQGYNDNTSFSTSEWRTAAYHKRFIYYESINYRLAKAIESGLLNADQK